MASGTVTVPTAHVLAAPAAPHILIHTPHRAEHLTTHNTTNHASAAQKTSGQSPTKPPADATVPTAKVKTDRNGAPATLKGTTPSKLLGRPSNASRRGTAESMTTHKDSSTAAPAERAKSSRRVLFGNPGDRSINNKIVISRPPGQRRSRFIDPSTNADRTTENAFTALQRQYRKGDASPHQRRRITSLITSSGTNGATATVDHVAQPMHSAPPSGNPASAPQQTSTIMEGVDHEPRPHHYLAGSEAEAPVDTAKNAALEPGPVSGLASTSVSAASANFDQTASSHTDSHFTTDSTQPQYPDAATATADDYKVKDNGDAGASCDAVDEATKGTTSTAVAAAALPKEPIMTTEMLRDKHIVISRPSINLRAIRMTDLLRPSDAYKLSLYPQHQRSALARRSRQPSKVLNVFLTKYPLIRKLAEEMGFMMETTEEELNEYKFNLCWSDTVLSLMRLVRLSNWQRTNHFPSMHLLCRKGHLGTTLGKLRRKLPVHFAYYPRTWSMRSERVQFTQYIAAVRQRRILKYFIMKPNSGCQGRGIIVARDPLTALDEHTLDNYIVQEYVHRPLLLEGKKFDLRVYVLLTSIRHPSIFLFDDGLVRICTEPYETPNEENVKQPCKHLTNYAVNKKSSDFVYNTNVEQMDVGNKRNFGFLNRWLAESGHSPNAFWDEVSFIIVKTILAAQPIIAKVYDSCFPTGFNDGYCCFEVLGFDILIDNKMKPWLMEVNHTPSFATETPLDLDIKSKLISEVWNIIDCKATDYEKNRQRERDEFAKRNMPPWATNHPLYGTQLKKNNARRPAVDDAELPLDNDPATADQTDAVEEIPTYVHARRKLEDTKLKKFKRIYPSENPDVQLIYDLIQRLATVESANSRLYYNSTVAAPVPTSMSSPPPSVRSNALLSSRVRPPLLGQLTSASRTTNPNSSPNMTLQQRMPTASTIPNTTSAGTPTDMIPDVIHIPSSPVFTTPSAAANNTNFSTASSAPPIAPAGADGPPAPNTTYRLVEKDIQCYRRPSSDARSGAPTASCTSTARSSAAPSDTFPTTTSPHASAKPPQPLRVYTPRVSPIPPTRKSSSGTPPSAAHTTGAKEAASDDAGSAKEVKPHVTEVHRRVAGHPSNATVFKAANSKAMPLAVPTVGPPSTAPHIPTPMNKPDAAPVASKKVYTAHHQNSDVMATSPHGAIASHSASNHSTQKSRRNPPRQTMPTAAQGTAPSGAGQPRANSRELSSTRRKSVSLNGSMRELDLSGFAHSRQRSQDRELHPPPQPTEEELARLATLQAMLDYEAAADPQPNDDDDYNLTE